MHTYAIMYVLYMLYYYSLWYALECHGIYMCRRPNSFFHTGDSDVVTQQLICCLPLGTSIP